MFTQYMVFTKKSSPIKTQMGFDTVLMQYSVTNLKMQEIINAQFIVSCKIDENKGVSKILNEFFNNGLELLLAEDFSYTKIQEFKTIEPITNILRLLMINSLDPEILDDSY